MSTPALPPGFVLDQAPPPPEGFVVDGQEKRSTSGEILRQAGLTARAGIQGLGGLVGIASDPIGGLINTLVPEGGPKALRARDLAAQLADTLGLPSPENALERVVGSATESLAGAGGTGCGQPV